MLLLISFACLSVLTAPAAPPVTEEKARPAGELSAEEILASSRTVMHGLGQLSGTSVLKIATTRAGRGYSRSICA